MKKCILLILIILITGGFTSLHAEFWGAYIPYATAWFSSGDSLTAHYIINMDDIVAYGSSDAMKCGGVSDEQGFVSVKPGDDILPCIKPTYIKLKNPLYYYTELLKLPYGDVMISESGDTLSVTDLDSLIYINTQMKVYMSVPHVSRREAALLQKKIYGAHTVRGSGVDYDLINTNPEITKHELLLYGCLLTDESERYTLDLFGTYEDQFSIPDSLHDIYQSKGVKALPELIYWAETATNSLESITPYLGKIRFMTTEQSQTLSTALAESIRKCHKLTDKLKKLEGKELKLYLDAIMNSDNNDSYFGIIFPSLPNGFYHYEDNFDWDAFTNYLLDNGVVGIEWQWD